MNSVASNFEFIRERIALAAARAGRQADSIRVLGVTKNQGGEEIAAAVDAGLTLLGENRVQEAKAKYQTRPPGIELHCIGHLQTNKAGVAAGLFDFVQTIDSFHIASELDRRCRAVNRRMPILVEANTSGEDSKYGYRNEGELFADIDRIRGLEGLRVRGLMTVGPLQGGGQARSAFRRLARLYEELRRRHPDLAVDHLSMGMSDDFEIAVEEGSTLVRIGTLLFGPRESR